MENNESKEDKQKELTATDHINKHLLSHFKDLLEKGEFVPPSNNQDDPENDWEEEEAKKEEKDSDSEEEKPKVIPKRLPTELITMEEIIEAKRILEETDVPIYNTPMLSNCEQYGDSLNSLGAKLYFKLESMQNTGSYKIRGIVHLLSKLDEEMLTNGMVSMSAGNFGRSFAYVARKKNIPVVVVMPTDVPKDRVEVIESYKGKVKLAPRSELMSNVHNFVEQYGMLFVHSFDDPLLFPGYGVLGLQVCVFLD